MIKAALHAILLVFSMPALAQTIDVTTGEHTDFTRVVLEVGNAIDGEISTNEDGYAVQFDTAKNFNVRGFFDLIPKDRIEGVRVEDNRLTLLSFCECEVASFRVGNRYLVIDVVDRKTKPRPLMRTIVKDEPQPTVEIAVDSQEFTLKTETLPRDIQQFENIVVQGVSRAATQGLLIPSAEVDDDREIRSISRHLDDKGVGILTRTDLDIRSGSSVFENSTGQTCLPDAWFAVTTWGTDDPFNLQVSELRNNLFGEFDNIDEKALIDLAKLYIRFGFGEEAKLTLELDGETSQERLVYQTIAELLEGSQPTSSLLDGDVSCEGASSLWAFLARSSDGFSSEPARDAILRAFRELPENLQIHFGPRLATGFQALEDYQAAEMALSRSISKDVQTFEASVAEVAQKTVSAPPTAVVQAYENLLATDRRMTPEVLAEYFDYAVSNDVEIEPQALTLADAMLFEASNDLDIGRLAKSYIEALFKLGRVTAGLQNLAKFEPEIEKSTYQMLLSNGAILASKQLEPIDFLELAFSEFPKTVGDVAQNEMAARLITLGFPQQAAELLRRPATGAAMETRRNLRARAAIAEGDTQGAQEILSGVTNETSDEIRNEAEFLELNSGLGFDFSATPEDTRNWRVGEWAKLAQNSDELLRDVSLAMIDPDVPQGPSTQPIAQGRSLLEEASNTRDLIEDVLTRFPGIESEN